METSPLPAACQKDSATTKGEHIQQGKHASDPVVPLQCREALMQTKLNISNHSMYFSIKRKAHPKPHKASHTLKTQWGCRTVFCLFCS